MSALPSIALTLALAPVGPSAGLPLDLRGPAAAPQPIIGGDPVALDVWTSVVAVIGISDGIGAYDTVYLCSGVLLDSQTVLTAAHCFKDAADFTQILVVFGDSIYTHDENRRTTAVGWATHPDYCEKCTSDAHDFGFAILADPPSGVPFVPPLVTQEEWDEVMVAGHDVTVVGFGATKDPDTNSVMGLGMDEIGLKNQVTMPLRSVSHNGLEFVAGAEGKDSCNGDSGGPAFAQLADGSWRLIGITSRGVSPCGTGKGIYGAAIAALPWIFAATGVDLLPEGCDDGSCVDTAPKESGGCRIDAGAPGPAAAGLGLFGLAWVRRRRRR
ncbi:MAG: trypsin-like serine protease [Nannocystaceae bacterium]